MGGVGPGKRSTAGGRRLKVFFDGGCRPNPGRIEAAVVARGETWFFDDLGTGTNEDAEWLALRLALETAQSLGGGAFDLIGDAAHVIAVANGTARCRSAGSRDHLARFKEAAAAGAPRRVRWIARTQNLAGIALAPRNRPRS
ncbi:MAG TPA: reverse transcriptase-like protein [Allosphingosinicella sp.]|jgi:ribonuclease HI|nr:reverse transcriptase-like protein [Allosphingosinicella sp.]